MPTSFYETDKAVSEYLLFHYGNENAFLEQGIGPKEALGFAQRCGCLHSTYDIKRERALDLGCAVGGSACEMSSSFAEVVAIDYAEALIEAATSVQEHRHATITVTVEGDIARQDEIRPPAYAQPERIAFQQGDAMNLAPEIGSFDFVLMANLIDRLPDPRHCLESIHRFVEDDGILAITSPYTWLEEYTPRDKWLGGYFENNQPVRSFDTLNEILSGKFELLDTQDLPFLIREHSRKNQFSVAQATIWKRK